MLTYSITVRPATAGSASQLIVADSISVKEPKLERSSDIFFATKHGELTRKNPNQRDLDLKTVEPNAPMKLREVSSGR